MKVARGTSAPFEADFVDPDGEGLVPSDPSSTPQVQIKDPEGNVLKVGLGKPISTKRYRFEWHCPKDSELNVPEVKYLAEWFFTIIGGSTTSHVEEFDVIDKVEPTHEERQQTYISLPEKQERLFFRTEQDPFLSQGELELEIRSNGTLVSRVSEVSTDPQKLKKDDPNRAIGKMERDGEYVFWYDTNPLGVGELDVFWGLRETAVSNMEYDHQLLRVPHWTYWSLDKSLRMIIDKLKKKIGWVQSYSNDQTLEYILQGLGMVNGTEPNTNWQLQSIPKMMDAASGIADAVITAAAIRALEAQQILEVELSFTHSGQTVTLDYNHDYGGVIGNLEANLQRFAEAKPRIYRVSCGPGVVGVRLSRNRSYAQRVFKVQGDYSDNDWYNPTSLIASVFT